ncbi:MAG: hypothetical protein ABEJ62_02465 [Candidatus Nanohaloarchaea archaeon]
MDMLEEMRGKFEKVLKDPEEAWNAVKKITGVSIGVSIASVSLSFTVHYVRYGRPMQVFLASLLFWVGYLFAHYSATGKLLHQVQEGQILSGSRRENLAAIFGVLLLLVGTTGIPFAASQGRIFYTTLSALVAALGYLLAHRGLTGQLM